LFISFFVVVAGGLTDNDFILAAKINELKLEGLLSKKKATTHE
jgi:pterin-4a-carbinolamine dehydratase